METNRLNPEPQFLSFPSSSGRGRCSSDYCNSPEFEFWMVRNPCFPQPNLLSADELFVDGVLLPLCLLSLQPKSDPPDETLGSDPPVPEPDPGPGLDLSSTITGSATTTTALSASKRWRDLFKKNDKKITEMNNPEQKEREKGKKKERKSGGGGGVSSSAELNINIWPFSRSRSAGNAGTGTRLFLGAPGARRVNSAPCSRSNSAGESKSRKWPSSPGRAGVHLGRSSPVWQVRRLKNLDPNAENGSKRETSRSRRSKVASSTANASAGDAKARVLSLNVPMCIGYKQHLSCRSDENSAICAGSSTSGAAHIRGSSGGAGNVVGRGGNLFNFRSIFNKKSVVTSH